MNDRREKAEYQKALSEAEDALLDAGLEAELSDQSVDLSDRILERLHDDSNHHYQANMEDEEDMSAAILTFPEMAHPGRSVAGKRPRKKFDQGELMRIVLIAGGSIAATLVLSLTLILPNGNGLGDDNKAVGADTEGDGRSSLFDEEIRETYLNADESFDDDDLKELVEKKPDLDKLALTKAAITDEGLKHLPKLKELKVLYLEECSRITNQGMKSIAQIESLRALDLRGFVGQVAYDPTSQQAEIPEPYSKIGDEGMRYLATRKSLRELNLSGTLVSDDGIQILADSGALSSLHHLGLNDTRVTTAAMNRLNKAQRLTTLRVQGIHAKGGLVAAISSNVPSLRNLELGGTGFTDAHIDNDDFRTLKRLNYLQDIRLTFVGSQLGYDGLSVLGEIESLQTIVMRKVAGMDGKVLAEISKLPKLERLRIQDNETLSGEDLLKLKDMESLRQLDLSGSKIKERDVRKLGLSIKPHQLGRFVKPTGDLFARTFVRVVVRHGNAAIQRYSKVVLMDEEEKQVLEVLRKFDRRGWMLQAYDGPIPPVPGKKIGFLTHHDSTGVRPGNYTVIALVEGRPVLKKKITVEADMRCDVIIDDELTQAPEWERRKTFGRDEQKSDCRVTLNLDHISGYYYSNYDLTAREPALVVARGTGSAENVVMSYFDHFYSSSTSAPQFRSTRVPQGDEIWVDVYPVAFNAMGDRSVALPKISVKLKRDEDGNFSNTITDKDLPKQKRR